MTIPRVETATDHDCPEEYFWCLGQCDCGQWPCIGRCSGCQSAHDAECESGVPHA